MHFGGQTDISMPSQNAADVFDLNEVKVMAEHLNKDIIDAELSQRVTSNNHTPTCPELGLEELMT